MASRTSGWVLASLAVWVAAVLASFAYHKHSDDARVAVALERLADRYAPVTGDLAVTPGLRVTNYGCSTPWTLRPSSTW